MPASSARVLIIRLDAIGDALALTPLLAAFAADGIPVDVVLREQNAAVWASRAIRNAYVAPFSLRSSARENLRLIDAFAAALRENDYTHVLVATEDPSGYRLAKAVGAAHRIGFVNGWGKPFKTVWARLLLTQTIYRSAGLDPRAPHECAVAFQLGRDVVSETEPTRNLGRLRPLVLESEPEPDRRVAMQITDKWERLGIPFGEVVELTRRAQIHTTLRYIGSAGERAYLDRFRTATQHEVETFDSLEEWKESIASATALIAPDSGAIHIAGMTGTPTVAVFPPMKQFSLQTARWAPWAAPYRIVEAGEAWPSVATRALIELDSAIAANESKVVTRREFQ